MTDTTDPYLGTPVPGLGEKLREPGAGWINVNIELAAAKQAMAPDQDSGTDFVSGTDPALNKQWIDSLKAQPEEAPCVSCTRPTTRTTAIEVYQQRGRNWALRAIHECEECLRRRIARKIARRLAEPDVDPDAREWLAAQLQELEAGNG